MKKHDAKSTIAPFSSNIIRITSVLYIASFSELANSIHNHDHTFRHIYNLFQ